jgi:probable poly-beta-1,6-N-acetyl-D-glucosamine export protein
MIRRLLYLNGLAVLGVILFHTSGMGFVAMFAWTHRYLPVTVPNYDQMGSAAYYGLRVIEGIVTFTIPAFLFISGFFIAFATGRTQSKVSWGYVFSRIKYLLVPYSIWYLVASLLLIVEGYRESFVGLVVSFATGRINPVFYYVPLLIQLYLLSPLLVTLAKKNWKALLISAALIQVFVQALQYPLFLGWDVPAVQQIASFFPKWFFPVRIFWFTLGIVIGFNLNEFKTKAFQFRWVFLSLTLIFMLTSIIEWEVLLQASGQPWLDHRETFIDLLYAGMLLMSYLAFDKAALPWTGQIADLGAKSYGIYLTHALFIEYTARIIYRIYPTLLGNQLLLQLVLVVVGLGMPLLMMAVVKRSPLRAAYTYLFG